MDTWALLTKIAWKDIRQYQGQHKMIEDMSIHQ